MKGRSPFKNHPPPPLEYKPMSGEFKRGDSPFFNSSPSLTREGDKGGRLLTNI